MSRDFWMVLSTAVFTTLFVAAAARSVWKFSIPGMRQQENMRQAEDHQFDVKAILHADPRLKDVRVGVYTGMNGAIWLLGSVENSKELLDLMRAVAELKLPVPIYWNVQVWSELEAESSAVEKNGAKMVAPEGLTK